MNAAGARLAAARAELDAAMTEAREAAVQLREEGASDYTIAAALGVNRTTVRNWLA